MAPALEPDEEVDLDELTRKYIQEIHPRLRGLTHYEALGIPKTADRKSVKRAYYGAIGMIHPDRYFKKNIGSYKPKMEQIFARLTEAYETLSSPDRRARYDATLGARPPAGASGAPGAAGSPGAPGAPGIARPTPPAPPRAPVDPRILAKRQAAMDALKQRFTEGKTKAREHLEAGHRARANQDYVAAAEAYRAALAVTPEDGSVRAAYEDVRRKADERVAESYRRQAQLEERHGHWREAAESWNRVCEVQPNDHEAKERRDRALARAADGSGSAI